MNKQMDERVLPWYRQFWFWFVFGPLIFIIILCGFTVSLALKNSDDVIIDNYYKQGRMINQTLDQDKRAQALGLSAELRFDRSTGEVILKFSQLPADSTLVPETLLLFMGHPVKAARDQQVLLKSIAPGQYRGELPAEPNYSWYLTLYPVTDLAQRNQAEWTLSGDINFELLDHTLLKPRID
jgi:hypothetical protein